MTILVDKADDAERGGSISTIEVPGADHYHLMLEHFADAVLNDRPTAYTLQDSLGVLSLGSQGRYALVQGIQFGWLDVGGPDLGRFTPLPAVPAGQYVNFAAW